MLSQEDLGTKPAPSRYVATVVVLTSYVKLEKIFQEV